MTKLKKSVPYFDNGRYFLTVEAYAGTMVKGTEVSYIVPSSTPELMTGVDRQTTCVMTYANTPAQQSFLEKRLELLDKHKIPYNLTQIELEI